MPGTFGEAKLMEPAGFTFAEGEYTQAARLRRGSMPPSGMTIGFL